MWLPAGSSHLLVELTSIQGVWLLGHITVFAALCGKGCKWGRQPASCGDAVVVVFGVGDGMSLGYLLEKLRS
jgi:hypothetical protein